MILPNPNSVESMNYSSVLTNSYQSPYLGTPPPPGNDSGVRVYTDEFGVLAAVRAKHLDWDSKVLGFPCARIEELWVRGLGQLGALRKLLKQILGEMDECGVRLVDVRIGLHALPLVHLAEEVGFRLADVLNVYLSRGGPKEEVAFHERIEVPSVLPGRWFGEAVKIATSGFQYARIFRDPNVPPAAGGRFYARLAESVLRKDSAVTCVALDRDGTLSGFVTGAMDPDRHGMAYLWLIGVRPDRFGTGVGRALLAEFRRRIHQSATLLEVSTQVDNHRANLLYQRSGLELEAQAVTLHRWSPCVS